MQTSYRLEMLNIDKRFGGVQALKDVSLKVRPGEIHALVGENGAGKSTLIKILAGVYKADRGEIMLDGEPARMDNTAAAIKKGVSVIYQEFALAEGLSVAENIFIDNMTNGRRIMHWKELNEKARTLLDQLGFSQINEKKLVSSLSIAYQQVIEICKAMSKNASILVLDEPTALLANKEVEQLFRLLHELKSRGVSIIYISHRLEEIFSICDCITVLKDGAYVDTVNTADINKEELVNMMIGRNLEDYYPKRNVKIGRTVFEVKELRTADVVKGVSFSVREGEILGISGLVGAGRTETARAIFGADKLTSGSIWVSEKKIAVSSPADALKKGIALLAEDRKNQGVLLDMPIQYNITMSVLKSFCNKIGKIDRQRESSYVDETIKRVGIKASSAMAKVASLSGGNQQKVSIAKAVAADSKIIIFDEPTRGVDIGSKIEIYNIINRLAEEGYAIIMISSEMAEIMGMCDRSIVMRNGVVQGELEKEEMTEENLIKYAMGV